MTDTTPPRADAARNVARILAAGRRVIREQGPAAPFYAVAAAAGVGQATLYRHFPNKKALVHAIVDENTQVLERAATDALAGGGGFDLVLSKLARLIADNADVAVLMAAEAGSDWYDAVAGRVVDALERAARHDIDRGNLRPGLSRDDVTLILQMVGSAATSESLEDRRLQAQRAVELVLEGVRATAD